MDHENLTAYFKIATPQMFDGTSMQGPAEITVSGGIIERVSLGQARSPEAVVLPDDAVLAPGFIDVQANGGGGVLFNDEPTQEGVRRIVAAHRKFGTTSCLPTLITDRTDVIERLAVTATDCMQIPGVLGFHLEGPALNKARKGIHLECHIRAPTGRDLGAMQSIGRHGRSIITIAPECVPSSFIQELIRMGFRVSAGHTDASAAEVRSAADRGMSGITHLFNAMSQLTSREPGVVGAALDDDRLFAGVICDGIHVDPANMRIAARCKGANRLMLITDAMPLVGTDQRQFELQGRRITLQDDCLTGPDGTLAGAHLTMIDAVRNAVALVGLSLSEALTMASRTSATFLGLDSELGAIGPGYRADLVAFRSDFNVIGSWVAGQACFGEHHQT